MKSKRKKLKRSRNMPMNYHSSNYRANYKRLSNMMKRIVNNIRRISNKIHNLNKFKGNNKKLELQTLLSFKIGILKSNLKCLVKKILNNKKDLPLIYLL